MRHKVLAAVIAFTVLMAAHAFAQTDSDAGRKVLGTVVNGNTTIEFEAANRSDLDNQQLRAWGDFAAAHAKIASALGSNPSLISNDGYVNKHADLAKLFTDNPGLRDAMAANPGNFVVPVNPSE
ncbi:MAG TPA: hypothetical protein VMA09_14535 [Candidatus Binataceae bacterium]|nr:hypothetical protein [Candidatus Binataceae bacterium]